MAAAHQVAVKAAVVAKVMPVVETVDSVAVGSVGSVDSVGSEQSQRNNPPNLVLYYPNTLGRARVSAAFVARETGTAIRIIVTVAFTQT